MSLNPQQLQALFQAENSGNQAGFAAATPGMGQDERNQYINQYGVGGTNYGDFRNWYANGRQMPTTGVGASTGVNMDPSTFPQQQGHPTMGIPQRPGLYSGQSKIGNGDPNYQYYPSVNPYQQMFPGMSMGGAMGGRIPGLGTLWQMANGGAWGPFGGQPRGYGTPQSSFPLYPQSQGAPYSAGPATAPGTAGSYGQARGYRINPLVYQRGWRGLR